ncbi:MAG: DUF2156 domain-containing protein [Oscillospiraceae bacterium]|nr:DUF2156 domain-containing protein [Oscillospiraceae bacterium]
MQCISSNVSCTTAIDWSPIELEDRAWFMPAAEFENSQSADFCFSSNYMWAERHNVRMTLIHGRAVVKIGIGDDTRYVCPIGPGELQPIVEALKCDAKSDGNSLIICAVTNEHMDEFNTLFPGKFEIETTRDYFDYIYSAESLATLSGRKLHSKRNHINSFLSTYADWSFEALTSDNIENCKEVLGTWQKAHRDDKSIWHENAAIHRAFNAFNELGLMGGILKIEGEPVAFTIGEMINSDTLCVHFEKALSDVNGAFPMVNREFVRMVMELRPELKHVNREDDMGDEGLRQAKESYHPEYLLEKYTLKWNNL